MARKLNTVQVAMIRARRVRGKHKLLRIALDFGVTEGTISRIVQRKIHKR